MRPVYVPITSGLVGALVPLTISMIDRLSSGGWWPDWIFYVWPTNYMMGATSAIIDGFWYEMLALSAAVNALLYAFIGIMFYVAFLAFQLLLTMFRDRQ